MSKLYELTDSFQQIQTMIEDGTEPVGFVFLDGAFPVDELELLDYKIDAYLSGEDATNIVKHPRSEREIMKDNGMKQSDFL
ncbi:hypothetical protein GCM10007063_05910 [Lentibacillus kapialis]|uniref:Uncharacterized protein n=1 Tax=Lentibacillus kapialis TaxID=340214 RepID=A0A917PNW1_9BACI|nr:hypothetical protein [Lentibacillus kapialis]GGJ86228.1 hypothetical protein GCM10007063_05910 [Lentibacillus kapialis]